MLDLISALRRLEHGADDQRHGLLSFADSAANLRESSLSASLPKRLEHGESADFRVHRKEEEDMKMWMRDLVEMFGITGSNIKTLRARIHTTTGHVEVVKPLRSFMEELAEAINSEPTAGTE